MAKAPIAGESMMIHALRHPNDRSAWKLAARKYGFGMKHAHRRGIYWKAR